MLERRTNVLLWFAFVGGALIWFFQFATFYALAEIRCNSTALNFTVLEMPGIHFISLLIGVLAVALVLYATIFSYRQRLESRQVPQETDERRVFMARASLYMNLIYLLTIIGTMIPVFFLPPCY
jgi:ABC-type antimicrobial peptide transport system permease subunit